MAELSSAFRLDRDSKDAIEAQCRRNLAESESAMVELLLTHDAEAEAEAMLDPNIAYIDVSPASKNWLRGEALVLMFFCQRHCGKVSYFAKKKRKEKRGKKKEVTKTYPAVPVQNKSLLTYFSILPFPASKVPGK